MATDNSNDNPACDNLSEEQREEKNVLQEIKDKTYYKTKFLETYAQLQENIKQMDIDMYEITMRTLNNTISDEELNNHKIRWDAKLEEFHLKYLELRSFRLQSH